MDGIVSESNLTNEEMDRLYEEIAGSNEEPDEQVISLDDIEKFPTEDLTITIPTNSPTLLMSEETSRFSSAEWFEAIQQKTITVAGIGGIGSYVVFLISRMHPMALNIYDMDIVEPANMSGQLYSRNNIGESKTFAIIKMVRNYSNFYNTNGLGEFTENSLIDPIAICGFDNMRARRIFYERWKNKLSTISDKSKALFIDGRLAAEEFQVLCMTGTDDYLMKKYEEEWLFSDLEAEETLCSYKQTSYCANMIASVMTNLLVNFVANECNPLIPRELPFITRYDGNTMMFKTEM